MASPVIPPPSHVIVGADEEGRPDLPLGTAEKRFYDWMLAIQRAIAAGGGIGGVLDGSAAPAGQVGEIIESNVTSGVGSLLILTSAVAANVTSIVLTPGDWRVFFAGKFFPTGGTNIASAIFSISTVSATIQILPESRSASLPVPDAGMIGGGGLGIASCSVGPTRISVTTNTAIFAVAQSTFTGGSNRAYGHLWAERRR